MNERGLRKNQTGTASKAKKNRAASAAGKKRRRMGEAWMKIMNAAANASKAAISTPHQPETNHATPMIRAEAAPHHIHTSESIKGSLTNRR